MAPTEPQILTTFLLQPAPLPSIISLNGFINLFPASTPPAEIARLYRHLTHQRALLMDAIESNIENEVARGVAHRRAVVRARRIQEKEERGDGEVDEEVLVERELFGSTTNLAAEKKHHTPRTVLPAINKAAEEIKRDIEAMEKNAAALLAHIQNTVGGLSDLRYGKFSNQDLGEEVVQALKGMDKVGKK